MVKKVKEKVEYYIDFTDEEINECGLEVGQKYTWNVDKETGVVSLTPYEKIDIDLGSFSRETLEFLIHLSCEKDISCNDVIENILTDIVKSDKEISKNKKSHLLFEDNIPGGVK